MATEENRTQPLPSGSVQCGGKQATTRDAIDVGWGWGTDAGRLSLSAAVRKSCALEDEPESLVIPAEVTSGGHSVAQPA